jgi:hypothetical protein
MIRSRQTVMSSLRHHAADTESADFDILCALRGSSLRPPGSGPENDAGPLIV